MKQFFISKFIRLLVLLIVTISSVTALAQRFQRHEVSLPDKGILTVTVQIRPPYAFSIKKENNLSWAKYEISDNFVFFTASVNTKKENRECIFVLVDGEGNPVDTLKLTQLGKVSTTTSKLANVSTVKSSGGGQCAARTKKGTRCSRKAAAGSIYCWQHNK